MSKISIRPQRKGDRLAVLMPGLGAVATTAIAGVEAVKRKLGQPIGSLTQLGYLLQEDGSFGPRVQDAVPMPALDELVFGGWDPIADNVYQAARRAKVLDHHLVDQLEDVLAPVKPMPAVFDKSWVRRLDGTNVKHGSKKAMAEALCDDIRGFLDKNRCARGVMVWTGSTEVYCEVGPAHQSLRAFEAALEKSDPTIAPSMIYAYAAMKTGLAYLNGAPNLSADIPAPRRQQGRVGRHRHQGMARLRDGHQGELPVPRLDPGRAAGARPGAARRPGEARRREGPAGVALLLLQEP